MMAKSTWERPEAVILLVYPNFRDNLIKEEVKHASGKNLIASDSDIAVGRRKITPIGYLSGVISG